MILSDLLQKTVRDHSGHRLGITIDARFSVELTPDDVPGTATLVGIIVSERTASSFRGYERTGVNSPWPIAQLLERLHRRSFLVAWDDIEVIGEKAIRLRTGFSRQSSDLPSADDTAD